MWIYHTHHQSLLLLIIAYYEPLLTVIHPVDLPFLIKPRVLPPGLMKLAPRAALTLLGIGHPGAPQHGAAFNDVTCARGNLGGNGDHDGDHMVKK